MLGGLSIVGITVSDQLLVFLLLLLSHLLLLHLLHTHLFFLILALSLLLLFLNALLFFLLLAAFSIFLFLAALLLFSSFALFFFSLLGSCLLFSFHLLLLAVVFVASSALVRSGSPAQHLLNVRTCVDSGSRSTEHCLQEQICLFWLVTGNDFGWFHIELFANY